MPTTTEWDQYPARPRERFAFGGALAFEHGRQGRATKGRQWTSEGLVERAQRGDHDAFAALAGASIARLDAAARLIVRDHDLARDAVQETLVRCWRDLPTLRDVVRIRRLAPSDSSLMPASTWSRRRKRRRVSRSSSRPLHAPATSDFSGQLIDRDLLERALGAPRARTWRAIVVLHYFLEIPDARSGADRSGSRSARPSRGSTAPSGLLRRPRPETSSRSNEPVRRRTVRMTTIDRFEHELPAALSDVAGNRSARLPHRHPRADRPYPTATRLGLPRKVAPHGPRDPAGGDRPHPWRALGVLALIAILMAAAIALYAGSQRHVPPPFGPAVNGLIPYVANGDIFVGDPVTGTTPPRRRRTRERQHGQLLARRHQDQLPPGYAGRARTSTWPGRTAATCARSSPAPLGGLATVGWTPDQRWASRRPRRQQRPAPRGPRCRGQGHAKVARRGSLRSTGPSIVRRPATRS